LQPNANGYRIINNEIKNLSPLPNLQSYQRRKKMLVLQAKERVKKMTILRLEINSDFVDDEQTVNLAKAGILVTPPISKDYWRYRVKLHREQAIIGFPKFSVCIGIGFAIEKDWNTNLPSSCDAEEIYSHIKHNKKYKAISDEMCLSAIRMIQDQIAKEKENA
jgi:hypothetical protein